eukprot:jgi/Mesvir1/19891/Mv13172-RA.1
MASTDYVPRPLQLEDFDKGFLELLSQLTTVGTITREAFNARFQQMQARGDDYQILVIEDPLSGSIVAAGTLLVELKFIHECGKVGHVEDIVVDLAMRGRHVGKVLVDALQETAQRLGCYKVILDCAENNTGFYTKCGFTKKEVQMVHYF